MQLSNTIRPDIAVFVNYLARFMYRPTRGLPVAGTHLLRYLKGTSHLRLVYQFVDLKLQVLKNVS